MVASHRTRDGGEFYIVETTALEGATGWRYSHGGRTGRGACVMHGGDNPQGMVANFDTGWITCFTHGCRGRIADHPETLVGKTLPTIIGKVHLPQLPPARPPRPLPDPGKREGLSAALTAAAARLPGSVGERFLRERGFTLEQAQTWGLGFGGSGGMAGRLVFPLSLPDGIVCSATGRATDPERKPKYWTLPADDFTRGWFNGAAVALARSRGWPLYACEGPFDAMALLAGGVPTAVAVLGVTGVRAHWLAGVPRAVVCFDNDGAGQKGRAELAFAAGAAGADVELMPPDVLAGCKDLGEYWQLHGVLPPAIATHWAEATAEELDTPVSILPLTDALLDEHARTVSASETDTAAIEAARLGVVSFAHWAEDLLDAVPDEDPEAPFWQAVLLEADALRRGNPRFGWADVDRCLACGTELLPAVRCRTCHGWDRPAAAQGVALALYFDDLEDGAASALAPTNVNMS